MIYETVWNPAYEKIANINWKKIPCIIDKIGVYYDGWIFCDLFNNF